MANNLRMLQFSSEEIGFVLYLGMGSWDFRPSDAGSVWRSIDGGVRWSKVLDKGYTAVTTTAEGFVIAVGLSGRCATSHDWGETWNQLDLDVKDDLVAIAALDVQNIVVGSSTSRLLVSRDGGKSWNEIPSHFPDFELIDVEITGPGKVWLLQRPNEQSVRTAAYHLWLNRYRSGDTAVSDADNWHSAEESLLSKCLCYTGDLGESWTVADLPPSRAYNLRRCDTDHLSIMTGNLGPVFARVLDNHVWTLTFAHDYGYPCDAIDTGTFCCGGYKHAFGFFAITHDSGGAWREVGISDNGVIAVLLLNDQRGWGMVGSYGGNMVWGTADGGLTWSRLTQPQEGSLRSPFEPA
jgi:hypothetical protein